MLPPYSQGLMMFRYLMIVAALLVGVYVAIHARWISRPAFLESVIDDVETEIKKEEGKAATPPVSEDAPPASSPAPDTVVEPAPVAPPEKATEPAAAPPTPAPKVPQGQHAPRAKKNKKSH
jgi:hypothetical protein